MKYPNVILSNLLILAAGVIFLLLHRRESVMEWVVVVSGILFALTGLLNIFMMMHGSARARRGEQVGSSATGRSMGWLSGAAAIVLGVIMIIAPKMFISIFVYIFAIALFFGGCYHIYMLARGLRPVILPAWTYILPVVLIAGSVYMFFQSYTLPRENQNFVLLMSGIGLVLYAVTSFIEIIGYAALHKSAAKPDSARVEAPSTDDKSV